MRYLIITIFGIMFLASPLFSNTISDSVVKITITSQGYDQGAPWKKSTVNKFDGSGCIVEGNKILTLAHLLTNSVLIEVTKNGGTHKYIADIIVRDYNSGLAIIDVKDKSFYKGLKPVKFAPGGNLVGEEAIVVKWDNLGSFKEYSAEIHKLSMKFYEYNCSVLIHHLTSGMTDGGNGEPVFIDGELIGIVLWFDRRSKTSNVCAVDIIIKILKDLKDGRFDGSVCFWIDAIQLESDKNFRQYLGLKKKDTGVCISQISPISSGSDVLQTGDVILSIDGVNIDDSGMYQSSKYGRLHYYGLISLKHFVGDTIRMRIVRKKKKMNIKFRLRSVSPNRSLIPLLNFNDPPKYNIFGGLIFQELSQGYLSSWGADWVKKANKRFLYYYEKELMSISQNNERIVILNGVLPASVNNGYQYKRDLILKSVNGKKVKNLKHLRQILMKSKKRFIKFDFVGETSIVLNREKALDSETEINQKYNIISPFYLGGK